MREKWGEGWRRAAREKGVKEGRGLEEIILVFIECLLC